MRNRLYAGIMTVGVVCVAIAAAAGLAHRPLGPQKCPALLEATRSSCGW